MKASSKMTQAFLLPTQLGVGHRGGVEQTSRVVAAIFEESDKIDILTTDKANAYGRVERQFVLHALRRWAPELIGPFLRQYSTNPQMIHYKLTGQLNVEGNSDIEHIKIEAKSNTGRIRLGSDRSANGDIISELFFQANDSAAAETDYALTRGVILDNTATAETARVDHRVMAAGTMTTAMALTGDLTNAVSLLVDGTLSTVTAGAPDSGGAGYRYLRIVN